MEFDWSILLQIPLVAAFIWFSTKMQESYQNNSARIQDSYQMSMEKRDEAYLTALNRIADDLKGNTAAMNEALRYLKDKK